MQNRKQNGLTFIDNGDDQSLELKSDVPAEGLKFKDSNTFKTLNFKAFTWARPAFSLFHLLVNYTLQFEVRYLDSQFKFRVFRLFHQLLSSFLLHPTSHVGPSLISKDLAWARQGQQLAQDIFLGIIGVNSLAE